MSNLFSLLGLDPSFSIDKKTLDTAYEKAQSCIHPDQWSSTLVKKACYTLSSQLTHAYTLLKNPLTRAAYLLQQKGAWPVPLFPDLMEDLFAGRKIPSLEEAFESFDKAWKEGDTSLAQKAYWWLSYVHRSQSYEDSNSS